MKTPTKKIEDDLRPLSEWAKFSFVNKITHYFTGCWTLTSHRHSSSLECLFCRKRRWDFEGWPIDRRFTWITKDEE